MFRFITFLVFTGMVLLAFLFAVNNTTEVSLWIGIALEPTSVGMLVIGAFIVGGVLGLILGLGVFRQLKYVLTIRQLRSQLDKTRDTESTSTSTRGH